MNRRNFIVQTTTVLTTLSLTALSQAEEPVECPPLPPPKQVKSAIEKNHGHILIVPYEDVVIGDAKTYSIKGQSSHDHNVVVTEEQFAILRKLGELQMESTETFGHLHGIQLIREKLPG